MSLLGRENTGAGRDPNGSTGRLNLDIHSDEKAIKSETFSLPPPPFSSIRSFFADGTSPRGRVFSSRSSIALSSFPPAGRCRLQRSVGIIATTPVAVPVLRSRMSWRIASDGRRPQGKAKNAKKKCQRRRPTKKHAGVSVV